MKKEINIEVDAITITWDSEEFDEIMAAIAKESPENAAIYINYFNKLHGKYLHSKNITREMARRFLIMQNFQRKLEKQQSPINMFMFFFGGLAFAEIIKIILH